MVLAARALSFGGAVALATASVSDWFSYAPPECGWTCYSPLEAGETQLTPEEARGLLGATTDPSTAFTGLGPWASAALAALVVLALAATALSLRGRAVPRLVAVAAALAAAVVAVRTATQPTAGFHRALPDAWIAVQAAAYAGVAGAVAAALGVALLARRRAAARPAP